MNRDSALEAIIRRLQAIPGVRDLQEMYEADEAKLTAYQQAENELLADALILLQEEIRG